MAWRRSANPELELSSATFHTDTLMSPLIDETLAEWDVVETVNMLAASAPDPFTPKRAQARRLKKCRTPTI